MNISLVVSAICDAGCIKLKNEDMILLNNVIFRNGKRQAVFSADERVILAVADGVGGLPSGEVASEQVLKFLCDMLANIPDDLNVEKLRELFNAYSAQANVILSDEMGSTLAALFFYNGRLFRCHAGDTRIYRLREGELERLTIDHSLRESGGQSYARINIMTNAIGGGASDYIEFEEIDSPLHINDVYLLSSDGMHSLLSQKEISEILGRPDAAAKLNALAKKYGGNDNISVVVINIMENLNGYL